MSSVGNNVGRAVPTTLAQRGRRSRPYVGRDVLVWAIGSLLLALPLLPSVSHAESARLRLATTTSTENSGLLAKLLPPFEKRHGVKVEVVAVGSGAAIQLAENGDADLVLSHAPVLEARFVASGAGVNARSVMYNYFAIVGPPADPAGIAEQDSLEAAMAAIARSGSKFVSRGDQSGTHRKEEALWKAAAVEPEGAWYVEAGQGMGRVLTMADELAAYTLTDRGTYLAMHDKLELTPLLEKSPSLHNAYTVIAVNPARHAHAAYVEAMTLIGWLTSVDGQKLIDDFRVNGERLFIPVAVP